MAEATHAVILANHEQDIKTWQEFCESLNLRVIATIYSDYNGTADYIQSELPILQGSVHYLERGLDVSERPMVQALARLLLQLSNNGEH